MLWKSYLLPARVTTSAAIVFIYFVASSEFEFDRLPTVFVIAQVNMF